MINHTTSSQCKDNELSKAVFHETKERRKLKIQWKERKCTNKFMFIVYKIVRGFFVSVYFYFFPFAAMMVMSYIPLAYDYC